MVALLGVTGEVNAAETPRKIVNDLTNGSATWYSDASKSAEITSVPYAAAEQTLYIDIQPAEGYWTSADELNGLVEKYVSPSAAESRTRSADISIAQYQVKTVSGQTYADNGGGLYQVTIPGMGASTDADKITKFVLTADFVACTDIGGDDSGGGGGGGSGITATAESTVYNGQNQTAVLKLGDTELTKGTDYTVDAGSSDTYKDADTYTIAITGKGRYKGTANVDYTIAKKEVGLTWTNNTPYLFNGSAQAPSVKVKDGDLVSGDACTVGVTIAAKTGSHLSSNKEAVDVGEYTATATGLSNSNYKLKDDADVSEDFSIVVNSSDVVVVTITGHNSTATYDGQSHSVSGYDVTSISNALYAESDFTFNGTATATRTDAGTTNMGLAASQFTNTNANFSVTFNVTDGFVTINRKGVNPNPDSGNGEGKVSITVDPTSFEYNGKAQKPTVTVKDGETANAPVIDAAEYTVSYKNSKGETVNETKNVGTYTIVITNKDGGNYVVNGTATYDITQKALTVTAKAKTIAYGSEASNDGVTYSGFVEGESATTEGLFSGSLTYQYNSKADGSGEAYKTSSPVGTYYIIPSGLSAKNYVISYVAGTLTVSNQVIVIGGGDDAEANATVSVTPTEFTYNGKAQKPEVKITLKDGNTVIPASEYDLKYKDAEGHEVSVTKNAGSYTLEISNKAGADYAFSGKTTANYTIKQKALTVMAKAKAISYGSEASNNGVEYSGFAEGESETTEGVFSGTLSYAYNSKEDGTGDAYTTSSPVGTYYIIPSGLMSGNYAITYKAGVLTVSDKVVVIGGEGDVDADATISVSPTEFTYNGKDQKPEVKITLKDGNTVISASEYDVKYKDAKGNVVSVTKNAGSYTLEITNKEGADYAFSGKTTANYTIKQKALTVTAKAKTISYGSEASNDGVEYSGFAEGESETTEGVFSGTLSYAFNSKEDGTGDAYTTESPVGTYYIIPSGLMSGNYAITYNAGVLTVSDKVVVIGGEGDGDADATISVSPTKFTYNGKDQKPKVAITLKDGNKVISASEYDVKYKDAEGHEVSVTKNAGSYTLEITNKEGADYAFSGKTTANYTIKPKALTVKAEDKTKKVGEEDPEFTYTYDGLVEGDKDVFSGALTRDEGETAGTYTIKLGTLSAGTNYTITYTGATLTIEEEPSPAPTPEEPEYTIKVVKTDGGKVTSNRGKAKKGKQVKLTVAADEDYYLTSISVVNDKTEKEVNTSTAYDKENNLYYTFTMPAANVTVKATFAKKEKDQNIFIFRNNYGEIASNVLHADPGQQVNLVRRLKNGYTNTELDELHVINDEGQQLQLFFYDNLNDVEHPVWFFFMKGKSVQIYNSFKGTNGVVDQSKSNSLRLEDGTLLFLLSDLYKSFFKTGEGTEAAQLAMSYVANILANFNASGELSVDKGPDDVDMALLNLLEGWKVMIDFEGVIKILNAEMLGLSDGARLTSDKIYELLTPGNLHLLLHSAYGPLLIKSITLIAPEPEPEEPVAINGLKADGVEGDVYDLRGRKVDTNSLRKGIYIRDGRKIVIK